MTGSTRRVRLILHAGTPKTGTKSLQSYLDRNRDALKQVGILYPSEGLAELGLQRHQWLVHVLRSANQTEMQRRLARIGAEMEPATHTVILSTEGLSNHWWDFPQTSKAMLQELCQDFDTSFWIWFREPVEFFDRYYLQSMKNPRVAAIPAYGRDQSVSDMLDLAWVAKHLEYRTLLADCARVFGTDAIYAFPHSKDIVAEVCGLLNTARLDFSAPRENATALTATGLDILRIVNRFSLNFQQKELACDLIEQINALIRTQDRPFKMTADEVQRIRQLSDCTHETIEALGRDSQERWVTRYPSTPKPRD